MTSVGIMASAVGVSAAPPPGTDTLTEPFDNLATWTTAGVTSVVAGRTGNGAQCSGGSGEVLHVLSTSDAYAVIGVAMYALGPASSYYNPAMICLYQGTTAHLGVSMISATPTAGLSVTLGKSNTGIIVSSAAGVVPSNAWCYVELQARIHATLGFVTLRVNGSVVANASNVNTFNGGTAVVDKVSVGCGAPGLQLKFDDLYVSLGSACTFQGDHTITTRFP